jgi:hypothetical protein
VSGNARRRAKKRRHARDKVWDRYATKSALLPSNMTLTEKLIAMKLPSGSQSRNRLSAALYRAGMSPHGIMITFDSNKWKMWKK